MIIANEETQGYLDRLTSEMAKIFGSGIVTAHIEVQPILLGGKEDDMAIVACDLWCDEPPAGYDINILVKSHANLSVLDTPIVTNIEDAEKLAMLIAQQVHNYELYD